MSYRFMRMLVMFDLPVETSRQRKEYIAFRKFLIKNGFLMMQESVYSKIMPNAVASEAMIKLLHKNSPPEGLVQALTVTEKQFAKSEYIVGEFNSEIISSDERLVIL